MVTIMATVLDEIKKIQLLEGILRQLQQGIRCVCDKDGEFVCFGEVGFKVKKIWTKETAFKVLANMYSCKDNIEMIFIKPKLVVVSKSGEAEVWL